MEANSPNVSFEMPDSPKISPFMLSPIILYEKLLPVSKKIILPIPIVY